MAGGLNSMELICCQKKDPWPKEGDPHDCKADFFYANKCGTQDPDKNPPIGPGPGPLDRFADLH